MMLRIAVFGCVLASALATFPFHLTPDLDDQWDGFKQTYNKMYTTNAEALRRLIWEDNVRTIEKHNLEADRGLHSYRLGMNEYGDLTNAEFNLYMNGFKQNLTRKTCGKFQPPLNVDLQDLPASVDWRTKGYVTPVKNQIKQLVYIVHVADKTSKKQCGSCWAFSTTGSLEGQHFRSTGKLVSLSEKNLMDCSRKQGNHGCEGGLMDLAFQYVIENHGIDTEASYPYKPVDGKCKFDASNIGATEKSCVDIKKESEADLQKAVATQGPISVGIDASHSSFQLYKSGVYTEKKCSQTNLDHGVLAVGYGNEDSKDYWLVKNSWGTSWGEKGYIKMARNRKNMCGIATSASFPVV